MELIENRQARRLEAPTTLDDLVERAKARAELYEDHREVVLGSTRVEDDGSWRYNGQAGRLSRRALSQLCGRLDLPDGSTPPAGYLGRCPNQLAADHLNHWIGSDRNRQRRVFVRTVKGEAAPAVRGVLSHRYATADNLPLLEMLRTMVPGYGLTVAGWSLDDELLTLRLVLGSDHPASLADPLRVGLHIANSEVGLSRITFAAFITRLVCANGLVVKVADLAGLHRRHIGRAGEDLYLVVFNGLTSILEEADESAWRFDQLRTKDAPRPLEDFIRKTAREAELPENYVPNVVALLEGETYYAVVNAFTRVAQQLPVAERVRIETVMSQFLREARPN